MKKILFIFTVLTAMSCGQSQKSCEADSIQVDTVQVDSVSVDTTQIDTVVF